MKNVLPAGELVIFFTNFALPMSAGETFHAVWLCPNMKNGPELPSIGRYMALGIQMVVVTAVIAAIGYWLDMKTGKEPLFLIIFFFLGAFGGIAVVWRALYNDEGPQRP